jgi:hypothetical protein
MKKNTVKGGTKKVIPFKLDSESVPSRRTYWIGVLQGTWKEMGIQYGQRTAKDIQKNFDWIWESILKQKASEKYLWSKGKTEEEKARHALESKRKSTAELSCLSPEIIEFIEGIAEGAAEELNKSTYANVCTNFEKITLINTGSSKIDAGHYPPDPLTEESDCNGFWVKGEATKTGDTFATTVGQGNFSKPGGREVAYIAIPKDPNARVFWGRGKAGDVGSGGGNSFNDRGVCLLTAGAQYSDGNLQPNETLAPGIDPYLLGFYAVIFSETAREAAAKATIGTPEYRDLTGRKTVLRSKGNIIVFADAKECYAVELNACHYAIRKPGYLGEKGGNYLAFANHFMFKDGSYDENKVWNTDEPMYAYTKSKDVKGKTSYWRFWSGMWMLYNNYGKIDKEMMLRELLPSHVGYDEDGNRYDPDANGVPTISNTFCDHYITPDNHDGYRAKEVPLGDGGGASSCVFVPNRLEVYWVEAWPCHFKDKEWNYLNLEPFSEYRKLLWGH